MNRHIKNLNWVLFGKLITTLKSKLNILKDKVSQINQNIVIYRLDFNDCDKIYIGESTRNLSKRINEHKNNFVKHQLNLLVFKHVSSDNWKKPKNNCRRQVFF